MIIEKESYSDDIRKTLLLYLSISEGILKGLGLIWATITLHASFTIPNYGFISNFLTNDQIVYLMRYWIPAFFWGLSLIFIGLYIRNIFRKNINVNNLLSLVSPILFTAIFVVTGIISLVIVLYY